MSEAVQLSLLGAPDPHDKVLTLAEIAKQKVAKKKAAGQSLRQNRVAVSNTYVVVPFLFANGKIKGIPMKRIRATQFGLPEMPKQKYDTDAGTKKVKGKGIGRFKGKTAKVSNGYSLKDRKTPTKGRKTGSTGRSIGLTKAYTRNWTSFRVPVTASVFDTIHWIKTYFKPVAYPELLMLGDQTITLGLKKTKAEHKAEVSKPYSGEGAFSARGTSGG